MSDHAQLRELLGLQSVKTTDLSFGDWLSQLKEKPWMADTAAALLVRAIESRGEVDTQSHPERAPYLTMLRRFGIPSYEAFDRVKGSQRTVARIMNHLRAAAANGMQLRQALILKGGPGCGKSELVKALKAALEGEEVFSVADCPVHENPINLLTLLDAETIQRLAKQLHMTEEECSDEGSVSLKDLIATAGEPCQHCWAQVFKGDNEKNPNLFDLKVQGERLSSREFGISTWTKDEVLVEALKRGSRGVVDMPEMFDNTASKVSVAGVATASAGNSKELDVLLAATQDRAVPASGGHINLPGLPGVPSLKLPTSGSACDMNTGWLPLDTIIVGQTNDEAFDDFIKTITDPGKFTRRMYTMNVPYVLSVTEEELAYREFIAAMRDQPHFDPMALKLAALLAVISRLKKDHEVPIVTRARMYDGEELVVEKKTAGSTSSASSEYKGGALSTGFGSYSSNSGSEKKEPAFWSVAQFWAEAGEDEGMSGLNMSDMLGAVSQIVDLALKDKQHQCVSSITMIKFLRAKLAALLKDPGLSEKRKTVLKNCLEFLKEAPYTDSPAGVIELEYRRVLKRQLLSVVAPDFEQRASELFEKYRLHAKAFAQGDKEAAEPYTTPDGRKVTRRVRVDEEFLNGLDKWIGINSAEERREFRRSVEAEITDVILRTAREKGDDNIGEVEITWRTLPKLAHGISAKLNDETAKLLERILQPEFKLNDEDKQLRREALARFDELGYCEHCRDTALQYFKDYQLWRQS